MGVTRNSSTRRGQLNLMGATNDNLLAAPQPRQNLHSLPIAVPDCNFLAFEYFLLKSHKNSKNVFVRQQVAAKNTAIPGHTPEPSEATLPQETRRPLRALTL